MSDGALVLIVIGIVAILGAFVSTFFPQESHGTLDDVHGLACEAVGEDVQRDVPADGVGDEDARAAARIAAGFSAVGGCDCPYCRSCRELHAQGFTYVGDRWVSVN